jgi:hypothetical protein
MAVRKMHQTTVRFGSDLWEALEEESSELGVSVAQFVREAALARLMYLAGRRGDADHERALEFASPATPEPDPVPTTPSEPDPVVSLLSRSDEEISAASALWAQGRQARRRARELRDESERRRLTS